MALPTSPNTLYAPTDPFKSADANDIQDQIVALHSGIRAARWVNAPASFALQVIGTPTIEATRVNSSGSTDSYDVPVQLDEGDRILAIRARVNVNTGGDTVTMVASATTDAGGSTTLGGAGANRATVGELLISGLAHPLAKGEVAKLQIQVVATISVELRGFAFQVDHP